MKYNLEKFIVSKKHDLYAIEAIKEAMKAAENGDFGVGAILVCRDSGEILFRGRNKVFSQNRSDLHAEMDLLNQFETEYGGKSRAAAEGLILFTSLESCPMCLCRIITSGIREVYHIADDESGGMVHLHGYLPGVWKTISEKSVFKKADCSEELSKIAKDVFFSTQILNNRLKVTAD